jgi:hypothetical protein
MAEFDIQQTPYEETNKGEVMKNVKEMTVSDGKVRIKDGAIYITDETGTDRVVIGFLKDAF